MEVSTQFCSLYEISRKKLNVCQCGKLVRREVYGYLYANVSLHILSLLHPLLSFTGMVATCGEPEGQVVARSEAKGQVVPRSRAIHVGFICALQLASV